MGGGHGMMSSARAEGGAPRLEEHIALNFKPYQIKLPLCTERGVHSALAPGQGQKPRATSASSGSQLTP